MIRKFSNNFLPCNEMYLKISKSRYFLLLLEYFRNFTTSYE